MVKDTMVVIQFDSPHELTYGPGWENGLSSVLASMKSYSGGFVNTYHHTGNTYSVRFGLPPAAKALLDISPSTFVAGIISSYYIEKYEITNVKVLSFSDA